MTMEKELERAWTDLQSGEVAAARKRAGILASDAPDDPEVLLLLGACAREAGEDEEALALFAQAASIDPEWGTPELWASELLAADPDRMSEALEHVTRAVELAEEEDEYLEALALKAGLEIDLGKKGQARKTLDELPPAGQGDIPPPLAVEFGHLFLALEDAAEARQRFQAAADAEPDLADAWYGLGLACEVEDDESGKRQAWLRTLDLDTKTPLAGARLDEDEAVEAAEQALGELSERARTLIRNVPIVVADLPAKADVDKGLDPRLLGVFEGQALPDVSTVGGTPQLTQIVLFRKNLERVAGDEAQLREEIRTTLLHETGHFFGMSEEDLENVGLD